MQYSCVCIRDLRLQWTDITTPRMKCCKYIVSYRVISNKYGVSVG